MAGAAALIRRPQALEVLQDEAGTLLMQLLNLQDSSKTDGEEAGLDEGLTSFCLSSCRLYRESL